MLTTQPQSSRAPVAAGSGPVVDAGEWLHLAERVRAFVEARAALENGQSLLDRTPA